MSQPDKIFELFRDWLSATNPGLVTRDDLADMESRLGELMEMVEEIEARLDERDSASTDAGAAD